MRAGREVGPLADSSRKEITMSDPGPPPLPGSPTPPPAAPVAAPPGPPGSGPAKKGLPTWAWVPIECGGIMLLGLIALVVLGVFIFSWGRGALEDATGERSLSDIVGATLVRKIGGPVSTRRRCSTRTLITPPLHLALDSFSVRSCARTRTNPWCLLRATPAVLCRPFSSAETGERVGRRRSPRERRREPRRTSGGPRRRHRT